MFLYQDKLERYETVRVMQNILFMLSMLLFVIMMTINLNE